MAGKRRRGDLYPRLPGGPGGRPTAEPKRTPAERIERALDAWRGVEAMPSTSAEEFNAMWNAVQDLYSRTFRLLTDLFGPAGAPLQELNTSVWRLSAVRGGGTYEALTKERTLDTQAAGLRASAQAAVALLLLLQAEVVAGRGDLTTRASAEVRTLVEAAWTLLHRAEAYKRGEARVTPADLRAQLDLVVDLVARVERRAVSPQHAGE